MDKPNYTSSGGKRVPKVPGRCKTIFEPTDRAVIYYGFHKAGAVPIQNVAWCHQKKHLDYSQLCSSWQAGTRSAKTAAR
ncbi:MAG: hypothetical protein KC731_11200 [Myxococcales bacterium]|nr:hypothetical protein [Myxococcales bacterium]